MKVFDPTLDYEPKRARASWRMTVLVTLVLCGLSSGIEVSAWKDVGAFKTKMTSCFEKWDTLGNTNVRDEFLPVIKSILTATIGADNPEIIAPDGSKYNLAELIYDSYKVVPYHNICHGIMVSFYTHQMLETGQTKIEAPGEQVKETKPDDDTIKALTFAGVFHDIGHNGFTNRWCNQIGHSADININKGKRFCTLTQNTDTTCKLNYDKPEIVSAVTTEKAMHKVLLNDPTDLVNRSEEVMGIWKKYFTPDGKYPFGQTTDTNFYRVFCESAEIQHAMIVKSIMDIHGKAKLAGGDKFIEQVVIAILATDMDLYEFVSSKPRYTHSGTFAYPYYHFVHMADILAVGEPDEPLRRAILRKVNYEFFIEQQQNENSIFKGSFSEKTNPDSKELGFKAFLSSQKNFISGFVDLGVKNLIEANKQSSSLMASMLGVAKAVPYQAYMDAIDKMVQEKKIDNNTELPKLEPAELDKFREDFVAVIGSQATYLVI